MRGWQPQHPPVGATRPTPGVTFVSRRKEPKTCQGYAPGPPEGGTLSPRGVAAPPNRVSATKIDRFATLSWWANRSYFTPQAITEGSHLLLPIRGSAGGLTPRMLEGLSYRKPIPLGAQGPGDQRRLRPLRRGSRQPGGAWTNLCPLSLREKVPGHGAERPYMGAFRRGR